MYSLDCTLRDGGYYNSWNFSKAVVGDYLRAMPSAGVDAVELGLRSLENNGFKGACAYTTDDFLASLEIPSGLTVGVMVNAAELLKASSVEVVLEKLFPHGASDSKVDLVRIACHVHEFEKALPACDWLKERGYMVGFNLMQVADRSKEEVEALAKSASSYPLDVLYFADSMGSMNPDATAEIVGWLKAHWKGPLGVHTHDNMGMALLNTMRAIEEGVTWVDSTVTGMGRGPGNARTEELAIELASVKGTKPNLVPLLALIRKHFGPMQAEYKWGTNPYYYLSGKYGVHPSYVQEMLADSRYDEEDILSAIDHLKHEGGKKFSSNTLDSVRHFYRDSPVGQWSPREMLSGRDVLLLGSGPGVVEHKDAIERFVKSHRPVVIALNTQSGLESELVDVRVACHPVRLLADCQTHVSLPQPLFTPASMLPDDVLESLAGKEIYDFGLNVESETFEFNEYHCTAPTSLVAAYALAVATSGNANKVFMAGFDGYGADDPRSREMTRLLNLYEDNPSALELISITPTRYPLKTMSVYAL